jgi:iron complex outermembrane recepter protein
MKFWQLSANLNLQLVVILSGCLSTVAIQPGLAEEISNSQIPQLSEIKLPDSSAIMLVQTPTPTNPPSVQGGVVPITSVKANPTDKGVEVILETTQGSKLQVANRSTGNNFIADITGGQLRLANGDAFTFKSEKPIAGITQITVTNIDANTVRVTVVGEKALPAVELFDDDAGLIFAVASKEVAMQPPEAPPTQEKPTTQTPQEKPAVQQDDPIELVVTGERDGYRVPNSTTATRTDAPLRDIPQSIQVIPQEVLRDQRADVTTALRNAPSVRNAAPTSFDSPRILVRGFFSSPALDGVVSRIFNGAGANLGPDLTGIERIEVLQGPNAVLFGSLSPGGTVNYITKKPLSEPYYFAEATVGSFDFYRGEIDLSGPLDNDKKILYRLNASYRDQGQFLELGGTRNLVVAPVVSAALGENTTLSVAGSYKDLSINSPSMGLPAVGTVLPNPNGQIPRTRNINEGKIEATQLRIGYNLDHKFSNNWSLNNTFRYESTSYGGFVLFPSALAANNRTLPRTFTELADEYREYRMATNAVGKFSTGSIKHELLFGVDLGRFSYVNSPSITRTVPSIDLFNPVFGQPLGPIKPAAGGSSITTDELGILVQDRIILADNFKLLLSGRFDTFKQTGDFGNPTASQSGDAFSPRVGIIYQPIQAISLYANYSKSFEPTIGLSFAKTPFQPSKGTQYEIGVKADLNNRLSTTLALYDITRSNVLTNDPVNAGFSVQTGEQRSQGVELNLAGEILPGWKVFAGYAYNDSRITRSNVAAEVGKRFQRTGPHAASLWTTYEIQKGNLQGLGFGLGLFYVSNRAGDNANTFELPSYLTTDVALFYKKDNFRTAINVKNLFNVDYIEGSFNRNRVFYGEPLTVQGTVSWTF